MIEADPDFRSPAFLLSHVAKTLSFYRARNVDRTGGFFHYYKDDGTVYDEHRRHLVSSARFVFNHAMAYRQFGDPEDLLRVRHGLRFIDQAHRQPGGGFAWEIDWRGGRATAIDSGTQCYGLAFVLLAYAHASMAGVEEARERIDEIYALMEARFWEPQHRLYANDATADGLVSGYRGQNANMHACEAMLAAYEATSDARYVERAAALADSVTVDLAGKTLGLVWEHFRQDWSVDWSYNKANRSDIFRPWGFQVGHLTEWAKLLLQLDRVLPRDWHLVRARHFFDIAMARGWDETCGGLVYGFSPDGSVCDADKYFWVQAESLAAAAWLADATNDEQYWRWYDRLWGYAWRYFVDHQHGAWYRILSPENAKVSDEKSPAGKTDYHTMGACYDVLRIIARQ